MTHAPASTDYVGRFAPSPTGPLHFGSLVAAVASYLDARAASGQWLLRIEDIDPPRAQAGAETAILEALERYGFEWHGEVHYQSRRHEWHRQIVDTLLRSGLGYPCSCSRMALADCRRGPLGIVYPGYCRDGCAGPETAIRVRTRDDPVKFRDRLQGMQSQRLETESGDFVVLRRDGLIAYQLAVVADDFEQGITHVVRGIDLLDSTPRQIYLQGLLGYPTPGYAHFPIITDAAGRKLGKSTGAPAIDTRDPRPTLVAALDALAQDPPDDLRECCLEALWTWAIAHWRIGRLEGRRSIALPDGSMAEEQNPLS